MPKAPLPALRLLAGLLLTLATLPALAQTITGRVVGVSDGDTLTLLEPGNKQTKVRLAQIDAPEKSQDFGQVSKQALSDLVFGKSVTVEVETTDRYGRTVGKVLVGEKDANLAQVKAGMAWVYRQYAKDPSYFAAEAAAKAAKVGIWSRPDVIPPWEYRHGGKSAGPGEPGGSPRASASPVPAARTVAASLPASSGGSCGAKSTCGQMASCAEARHYLNDCGLSKLDRDGDGTPCESLCK
jgi:endonuclease YncB( thermonuclease family)